ncbi:MAG: UDP-N-acetyl glucosamine 2-epimerase, partial [Planctomycetota bacterium]
MKIAPILHALEKYNQSAEKKIAFSLIHTGQHYDQNMSGSFFEDLNIPEPDFNLGVGSGSQAEQTAKIMLEFDKLLASNPTSLVVVVGDVNSTMACTVVAKKLLIPVAHIEAGLRSFDMEMPEEINRLITDRISDLLFTTDPVAEKNLTAEGVPEEQIIPVGNVMIDTLLTKISDAEKVTRFKNFKDKGNYALLTLHRPSNVDDKETLESILAALEQISLELNIIFPCHPRTSKMLESFNINLP